MEKEFNYKFEHILLTLTSVVQILVTVFSYHFPVSSCLRNCGWVTLWIAGIFGVLPIFVFKKYGNVDEGNSYIHTNQLVDKGIYSIVRHPQYFSGILISIGLFLIAPGWLNLGLGIANILQYYTGTIGEEKILIARYGQEYMDYQKKVPRLNPLWGIIKRIFGH